MLGPRPYWTEQEDTALRFLWADGWSVNAIASVMPGRSRNAITGRCFRLGLEKRDSPIPAKPKPPRYDVPRYQLAGDAAAREAIARAA